MDYDFYVNTYLGTRIPEKAFAPMALRAEDALRRLMRRYAVRNSHPVSEKMAICAIAEAIYGSKDRDVSAASMGGVSVRYEKGSSLNQQILQQARIYLDFYRGATVC